MNKTVYCETITPKAAELLLVSGFGVEYSPNGPVITLPQARVIVETSKESD